MSTQQSMKTASKMSNKILICAHISVSFFFSRLLRINLQTHPNDRAFFEYIFYDGQCNPLELRRDTHTCTQENGIVTIYRICCITTCLMLLLGLGFNCKPNYVLLV